jgi:hypothetical protein
MEDLLHLGQMSHIQMLEQIIHLWLQLLGVWILDALILEQDSFPKIQIKK